MQKLHFLKCLFLFGTISVIISGCATESSQAIQPTTVRAAAIQYSGEKASVSIGKFQNLSQYMRGIFSDGVDRLGNQSKTILANHLQQSGRFSVLDRSNMSETSQEAKFENLQQELKGATYVITGNVTEFGRKEIGDQQLFGVLGSGKSQIAYAKVAINIVEVKTGEVVFSSQGAGEYKLNNREVLGFGSTAAYDSTLNGKVLDLAIREAVDFLALGVEKGQL